VGLAFLTCFVPPLFTETVAFEGAGDLAPAIGATAVGILTCHIPYGADVKVVAGGDWGEAGRLTGGAVFAGAAAFDFAG